MMQTNLRNSRTYEGKFSYVAPNAAVETVVDTTKPVTFHGIFNPTLGLNVGNATYRFKTLYIATATALFMNLPPVGEMNAANITPAYFHESEPLPGASFGSWPIPISYGLSSVGRDLSFLASFKDRLEPWRFELFKKMAGSESLLDSHSVNHVDYPDKSA